ncbi:CotD family spore coat protein [Fictibacillus phosphorivorans]|uniref:CotD family spore coat protein n=1 Tax=Fictibacillus phosphorivorans TaxID=1221500 RepID=UPI00203B963A|nr:CotD family spore coat protein [Fictibacillus phosphorivorans]MCM3719188.1 spore coat protein [Fictibacillus phosphorivorans]MCM3776810.1 spore coat protein [Fictibacillus phosphorivorans]
MFKRPRIFPKKGMGMPTAAAGAMGMGPTMGAMGMGPVMGAMSPQMGGTGYPAVSPSQYYPPQVLPAQYTPTKQQLQYNQQDVYVPIIHPTQNTQVNQTNYKYVHYFPQNTNVVNQSTQQNVLGTTQPIAPNPCPPPCVPCPPPPCGWRKK